MELHLEANPHFYDYLHRISLYDGGKCGFVDGGGQCVSLDIEGIYECQYDDEKQDSGSVEFRFDTEYYGEKYNMHFKVNFKVQHDTFMFVDEIVWNSKMEDRDISIYNKRYVFDEDPFFGLDNRKGNLYFILEGDKESTDSRKYFYSNDDKTSKKMKELNGDELDKIKEIKPDLHKAFVDHPTMTIREYMKLLKGNNDDDSDDY